MIVMKFGGTSVESAEAISRVASIVRGRLDRKPVVVVSAMGKTTNKLLAIADEAVAGRRQQALELLCDLHLFHLREARKLVPDDHITAAETVIDSLFRELENLVQGLCAMAELTPRAIDAISSYGERLSSALIALAFNFHGVPAEHLDARTVIITDSRHTQAAPNLAETYARCAARIPPIAAKCVPVMGGFIASSEDGIASTLGRGGSDFTASLVGAGIGAEEIEIWTDVDGMLTADPTIVSGGHRVKSISFAEAAELAYFGAKVLHPSTVLPAVEKNVPVRILNSRRPHVDGTRLVRVPLPCKNPIKSIACKKKITLVNIHSTRMLMAHGFLHRIFGLFDRYATPVDLVATSEVSVSLTIDNDTHLEAIGRNLREFSEVSVEQGQAIIALVGENIRFTPGVASRVFGALGNINIRLISQGASLLNLSVVVAESDLPVAVERLHSDLFAEVDPEVFD